MLPIGIRISQHHGLVNSADRNGVIALATINRLGFTGIAAYDIEEVITCGGVVSGRFNASHLDAHNGAKHALFRNDKLVIAIGAANQQGIIALAAIHRHRTVRNGLVIFILIAEDGKIIVALATLQVQAAFIVVYNEGIHIAATLNIDNGILGNAFTQILFLVGFNCVIGVICKNLRRVRRFTF